jgi:serine/threonine-protein kinase RsbW
MDGRPVRRDRPFSGDLPSGLMAESPNVRLSLTNRSENVLVVREALTGLSEAIGLHTTDLYDIKTAVTEACNNVVVHAYEGDEGPIEIELYAAAEKVEVVVRDQGIGIHPRIGPSEPGALGIGLTVIQALVSSVEFSDAGGQGTEVRMQFATPRTRTLEPVRSEEGAHGIVDPSDAAATVRLTIGPEGLARAILPRLLSVLASHAHFSTDRISDTQLLADALALQAGGASGTNQLGMTVTVLPRVLQLHVGPLPPGNARRLMSDAAFEELGPLIERLTDEQRVAASGPAEVLALRLSDTR